MTKIYGPKWKKLDISKKEKYDKMAQEDKDRYHNEMNGIFKDTKSQTSATNQTMLGKRLSSEVVIIEDDKSEARPSRSSSFANSSSSSSSSSAGSRRKESELSSDSSQEKIWASEKMVKNSKTEMG